VTNSIPESEKSAQNNQSEVLFSSEVSQNQQILQLTKETKRSQCQQKEKKW
jgi:hypothetical protein